MREGKIQEKGRPVDFHGKNRGTYALVAEFKGEPLLKRSWTKTQQEVEKKNWAPLGNREKGNRQKPGPPGTWAKTCTMVDHMFHVSQLVQDLGF